MAPGEEVSGPRRRSWRSCTGEAPRPGLHSEKIPPGALGWDLLQVCGPLGHPARVAGHKRRAALRGPAWLQRELPAPRHPPGLEPQLILVPRGSGGTHRSATSRMFSHPMPHNAPALSAAAIWTADGAPAASQARCRAFRLLCPGLHGGDALEHSDPRKGTGSPNSRSCTWPPQDDGADLALQLSELTEGQLPELPLALLPAQTSLEIGLWASRPDLFSSAKVSRSVGMVADLSGMGTKKKGYTPRSRLASKTAPRHPPGLEPQLILVQGWPTQAAGTPKC